jgi:hypothetical protein
MEHEKDSNQPSVTEAVKRAWGGARPGSGRPKGSTDKLTARHILETAERIIGKPLIESVMEGYRDTILDGDRRHRTIYEKMLVDKVATTLFDVEVTEDEDLLSAKRQAFAEAMAQAVVQAQQANQADPEKE